MGNLENVYEAVLNGSVDTIVQKVHEALDAGSPAQEILNQRMIAAMDEVGRRFGEGEYFIPQVLWSAKAMQAGMEFLKDRLAPGEQVGSGKVVIGTVEGDIHDIGKNLVAMMFEGAGFTVFDLGVDVPPERFVEKAKETDADVIALSALLTTTMPAMKSVIDRVKASGMEKVKVIIGGAPVDDVFRKDIGADAFGVDAPDGVKKVRTLLPPRA